MSEHNSNLQNFDLAQQDLEEVIITPEECSTQGGEQLKVVFPCPLPEDPVLIFLHGSLQTHKLEAQRLDSNTVAVTLPAHRPAEVVDISIYQMPPVVEEEEERRETEECVYQPRLLLEDKILYTDLSSYLAELLVQSVSDSDDIHAFYSMLPPLASLDKENLENFDQELTTALKEVELPEGWSLFQPSCGTNNSNSNNTNDNLLHFAAHNSLIHLFSLLLSLPGGRQASSCINSEGLTPLDLAKERDCLPIISLLENIISSTDIQSSSSLPPPPSSSLPPPPSSSPPPPPSSSPPPLSSSPPPSLVPPPLTSSPPPPPSLVPPPLSSSSPKFTELQSLANINYCWIQYQLQHGEELFNHDHCLPSSFSLLISRTPTPHSITYIHRPPLTPQEGEEERERLPSLSTGKEVGGVVSPIPPTLFNWSRKWMWSRVVGNRRSRSVGTGLNELHRLRGTHSFLSEANQDDNNKLYHASSKKEEFGAVGCCLSCPVLCDNLVSDMVHSTLTSPKTFEAPVAFQTDFTTGSHVNHTPHLAPPHNSIKISVEDTTEEILPVSANTSCPPLPVPYVCVEDLENGEDDGFCIIPSPRKDDTFGHSSGEEDEEDEEENNTIFIEGPLASKSAPLFAVGGDVGVVNSTPSLDKTPPPIKAKSYSVSEQGEYEEKREKEREQEREENREREKKQDNILNVISAKVSTTPSTPVTTPTLAKRTHRKSQSVSGVVFTTSDGEDEEYKKEPELPETRSHASSFISTSSKQSSDSEEDDDDEQFLTANESKSVASLLSPSGTSFDESLRLNPSPSLIPSHLRSIDNSQSEEDSHDGPAHPSSRAKERRYSLNVVTNVDDYSASSEDESHTPRTRRNKLTPDPTTPTHRLSVVSKDHTLSGHASEDDVTLSDIEIQVNSSLDNSFNDNKITPPKNELLPLSNGPSPRPIAKRPTSPLVSRSSVPTDMNAKQTIQLLKSLLHEEDDDTGADMPPRPLSLPSESPTNRTINNNTLRTTPISVHSKVSRNTSSASDTGITYLATPTPVGRTSSSLDFIHSPDSRSSPRLTRPFIGETSPHPPSPLSMTPPRPSLSKPISEPSQDIKITSPSSSPLDKKAKSVDNLTRDDKSDEVGVVLSNEKETTKHNVRFESGEKDDEEEERSKSGQRKDIQSYLGIIEPGGLPPTGAGGENKEQTTKSKGISKLFRRDSKKDKRSKKTDSQSSLDSVFTGIHEDKNAKSKTMVQPPKLQTLSSNPSSLHNSPSFLRKPRSQTIHGDCNLTTSQSQEFHTTTTKETKKSDSLTSGERGTSEDLSPPPSSSSTLSPRGKLEGSLALAGDSELGDDSSLSLSIDDHPLLSVMEEDNDVSWYRTIDRRLRRSINKHEKGRQGAIFDFVRTERHIYRSVLILKLFFRDKMSSELNMSEEVLDNLFPYLDSLLEVTKDFATKLETRQRQSTLMITDISDILLEQFTGVYGERMKEAYTGFICHQSEALELYRDLERKRQKFARLMSMLYAHKHCERRKLQDFYLLITQRVAKYVEMMKKLVRETEALKLDHVERLRESNKALHALVTSIDHGVLMYENRKELEDIQSRLEIQLSRNSKSGQKYKGLKKLDLLAQNRLLIKTADVQWHGRGKSLGVHLVLVTDLIVLLTERDQKYHLASLQDWNPPAIRLFFLHVRVDAAVRSGVQLLLLEQGDNPEMFRIEFSSKKQAKEWEETLNKAVENCRANNLRCEHFGAEPVLSGDEGKEEDEYDGEPDPLPDLSPNAIRHIMIHHALTQAHQHLTVSTVATATNTSAHEGHQPPRHSVAITTATRNHQLPPSGGRTKPVRSTTFNVASRTASVDVIDTKKKKKPPERGMSFVDKKDDATQQQQQDRANLLECISNLKDSIEFLLKEDEEKSKQIEQLKFEIADLKLNAAATQQLRTSPIFSRPNSAQRSLGNRPHSVHSDLFKPPESDIKEEREGDSSDTTSQLRTK